MTGGWRLAAIGLTFAALFGVLGLRLWSIQVTHTDEYVRQAEQNQVRLVNTPAPRGNIYDANGVLLAGTRPSLAAVADLALIDEATRQPLAQNMAAFLGISASDVIDRLENAPPGSQLILAEDLTELQALTIFERREDFPGVAVIPHPVRDYEQGDIAAHVLGYIGKPSRQDLDERPEVKSNDVVGKAGVERIYDNVLRGTEGTITYRVDARRSVLALEDRYDPKPGSNLVLTIDGEVQRQLQQSLEEGLNLARTAEMQDRVNARDERSIPERVQDAFDELRAEQVEQPDANTEQRVDDTDVSTFGDFGLEPLEIDEGAVLGPLYPGLPVDSKGVCVPVQRVDLDLHPDTGTPKSAVLSGALRRDVSLDAVLGEDEDALVAVITVAGEPYRVTVNDVVASTVRVVAIEAATESAGPSVILHHQDKYCPVRSVGVVLDPGSGAVVAMASFPTYEPNAVVDGLSTEEWRELGTVSALTNFAVQGQYPPASTMKSVAYVMAMEEEVFPYDPATRQDDNPVPLESDTSLYECAASIEFKLNDGTVQRLSDWRQGRHLEPLDLHTALRNSCDLYFWDLAFRIHQERADETGINNENLWQEWARSFGFDSVTGVDLPFERSGLIPDRAWFREEQDNNSPRVRPKGTGGWVGGDLLNAIVGEGAVLTTPLQLANAYAAMVNGGTLYQPYVVAQITNQAGSVMKETTPTILTEVDLDPVTVASLRSSLQRVVNEGEGTADDTFHDRTNPFGSGVTSIGGKTGTGEVIKARGVPSYDEDAFEVDNAWFVGVTPVWNPQYVVAAVVERGGSGGGIAAPIVKQVLQYLVLGPDGVTPQQKGAKAD